MVPGGVMRLCDCRRATVLSPGNPRTPALCSQTFISFLQPPRSFGHCRWRTPAGSAARETLAPAGAVKKDAVSPRCLTHKSGICGDCREPLVGPSVKRDLPAALLLCANRLHNRLSARLVAPRGVLAP